ncbi:MAG: type I methionyl aminopeptidase, partial [Ignavibacteria bacterium]
KDGDIVSIDCGVQYNGYFGDSAYTFSVGTITDETERLLRTTQESLDLAVQQAIARNKVYDIARAVQTHVEKNGFSVVRQLVGHGIGKQLHEDPAIPNFVPPLLQRSYYPNAKLQRGKTIAIEPMVNIGTHNVKTLSDGWTVITADKKPSAHFEHTVLVEEGKPIILTLMD